MTDHAERRSDYQRLPQIIRGWVIALGALAAIIGAAAGFLGAQIISPGTTLVKHDLRITALERDHAVFNRQLGFLVTKGCMELDAPTKRYLSALGFLCSEVAPQLDSP